MAYIINDVSRTFSEYLLIPGLTTKDCFPDNVSLRTPLVKFRKGDAPEIELNVPFASAIMQSVSDNNMAIALARNGGVSFIFGSQSMVQQAEMVSKVKKFKAGFVVSNANLTADHTLKHVIELKEKTGFSTIGITDDGSSSGKLLGIVTGRDYRPKKTAWIKR
jgi:IMP dehydrogenase